MTYQMQRIEAMTWPLPRLSKKRDSMKTRVESHRYRENRTRPLRDLSAVYPELVLESSEDLGWQDIRFLYVSNEYADMDVPPLENHCLIVQLEPAVRVRAKIDEHDFDKFLSPGDITIIPAGARS